MSTQVSIEHRVAPDSHRALARRAGVVATGTAASRVLGAARDAVIAASFPAWMTDAFFVAFTIPNALRALLGEGAVSAAFVPVLSEVRAREGEAGVRTVFGRLTGLMLLVLVAVTALGAFGAPWLVTLYAAGYLDDPGKFWTTSALTRWLFPYIFLMGLVALLMGALHERKRFAAAAFAPLWLNVALIAAALALPSVVEAAGLPSIGALVVGALTGGLLQLGLLYAAARRLGVRFRPRLALHDPYVQKAIRLLVPLLAVVGVYQVNLVLSRLFASFLAHGAQSYLYYAQRFVEIPQGVFGVAIATASLPMLSELRQGQDLSAVRALFFQSLRLTWFVAMPAVAVLWVLAEPLTAVVLGRGEFAFFEVQQTASALRWLAFGVWAVAAVRSTVPAFHACNDTRSPVVASGVNLVIFSALSLLLMPRMGHNAIALGNMVGAVAQLLVLMGMLHRRLGALRWPALVRPVVTMVAASVVAGLAAWLMTRNGAWHLGGGHLPNVVQCVAALMAAMLAYFGAASCFGSEELNLLISAMRKRLGRGV